MDACFDRLQGLATRARFLCAGIARTSALYLAVDHRRQGSLGPRFIRSTSVYKTVFWQLQFLIIDTRLSLGSYDDK